MTNAASSATKTPGARKATRGDFAFELAKVNHIYGGPDYSTANGSVIEGERMMVALMRMPAGTGAEKHSHPNEQWIYILEGTFDAVIDGKKVVAPAGTILYIPSNVMHEGKATPDADVLFFTCKDTSHSLHGIKAS
jgi:quercetin dioxygenase-like cupin family protein